MNYCRIYSQLIERAKIRSLPSGAYIERHHIVPKCMGGLDDISNLVSLTPEEHLLAHLLLVRIYPTEKKLVYAANMMSNRVSSIKHYGWVRRMFSETERDTKRGMTRTESSIENQRLTMLAQYAEGTRVSARRGMILSQEHKDAISKANKGKTVADRSKLDLPGFVLRYGEVEGLIRYKESCLKRDTNSLSSFVRRFGEKDGPAQYKEHRDKASARMIANNPFRGKAHNAESRRKISESNTGKTKLRTAEHNAKIGASRKGKPMPTKRCGYCGKECSVTNIKRWHDSNCKSHLPLF